MTPLVSGYECIRRAREQTPDAIVIDEAVRELPVGEIVSRLRDETATAGVPILTLWDQRGDRPGDEQSAIAGSAEVLLKPFTPDSAARAVADAIARAKKKSVSTLVGNPG